VKVKKKRNKAYKQKHSWQLGGLHAILDAMTKEEMSAKLSDYQKMELRGSHHAAMFRMVRENSDFEALKTVTNALNAGLVLCNSALYDQAKDHVPIFIKALEGAFLAHTRSEKGGIYRFDVSAIMAINEALEIHDAQLELISVGEFNAVLKEIHRRERTGNVYRVAK
jgi:hypothetical protein